MTTIEQLKVMPRSIPDLVFKASERYGSITALEEGSDQISYAALPQAVMPIAKALLSQGIEVGDRVAIWAPNSSRWVLAALGLQMVGAVLVPLNTRMKAKEAADILARSGARTLFIVGDFLDTNYPAMIADDCPDSVEQLVVISDTRSPLSANHLNWAQFLALGDSIDEAAVYQRADSIGSEHLSDLMFTSGTTGQPKGVMSRHGAAIQAFTEFVAVLGLKPADRYLVINPFFHAFGYKAGWLTCLLAGATILPQTLFDAETVLARIEQDKISVLPGPPTLYLSLLAHPNLKNANLSSLRVAVTGASTIPPVLIERMRSELGIQVVTTAYGLTECGGLASICSPTDEAITIATTSGKAITGTEISIQNADGKPLAAGESGEICIRGFHVMQGYFQNPAATAETIDAQHWLHTGDIGHLDEKGYLQITGRLKDMFIVGGFNCYPAEIEAVLTEHPAIAQSAVIGVPDDRMGEVGCVFVVLKVGEHLESQSLIHWCRERMANYKVPRFVRFVDSLPVNASNKVLKNELQAVFGTVGV